MEFQDKCPNCGHPRQEGAAFCGNCGKPFHEQRPDDSQPPPPPPTETPAQTEEQAEPKYVAWEDKENLGFFQGLLNTWKDSVFSPDSFFSKLPYRGGIGSPLLYALIVSWIGIAIEQVWSLLFSGMIYDVISEYAPYEDFMFATGLQTGFSFMYVVFVAPILVIFSLFVTSGILHLIMLIFGWAKRDFEATFRAIAYAHGPILFYAIPMCGGLIGIIWTIVLSIIGLKHMQKTTGGKAALVYFLPIILCCCVVIALILIFGAALFGFIEQFSQGGYYQD
ncbi:MAG: YIP1 family protein [candidate division Zixibacteria bacterium]